ncbi:MAG TPA: hypothetical protein VL769_13085, partial [Acidimicrobiia bacterium]|nr:hypothetical protein [Acidimicrobiia bacterium]
MGTDVATFTGDEHDPAAVIARLAGMGFEFGPSRVVIRSLLDTFDGRLSRAGLRLELRESDGLELVLTGKGSAGAHLTVTSVPRFAADLPPGPFRSRLVALAEVGLSRVNGDTLTIAAAASGAHLEGASRRAGVPLD